MESLYSISIANSLNSSYSNFKKRNVFKVEYDMEINEKYSSLKTLTCYCKKKIFQEIEFLLERKIFQVQQRRKNNYHCDIQTVTQ